MPPQEKKNPYANLNHPYAIKDAMYRTTELHEAVADYLDKSYDLHEQELKLAEITKKHIAPLEEVFERVQKHTEFRAAIYSMFGHTDEHADARLYEANHEK